MGKVQTLRLRRTHDIEYSLDQFLASDIGQTGFCLEGWVNFAPMDNRARVYPEARYSGKPLLLKPGTYPKLTGRHFRELRLGDKPKTEETETFTLASLDLPEGVTLRVMSFLFATTNTPSMAEKRKSLRHWCLTGDTGNNPMLFCLQRLLTKARHRFCKHHIAGPLVSNRRRTLEALH